MELWKGKKEEEHTRLYSIMCVHKETQRTEKKILLIDPDKQKCFGGNGWLTGDSSAAQSIYVPQPPLRDVCGFSMYTVKAWRLLG